MRIEELMVRFPATCGPDDTLSEAAQKMQGGKCACLPVTAGEGLQRLVGMISESDIWMVAQLQGWSLEELRVKDVMANEIWVSNPGDSLVESEAIMQEADVRRLPVVDESGRLLGLLSLSDLVHAAELELASNRRPLERRAGGERRPQMSRGGQPSRDVRCSRTGGQHRVDQTCRSTP